MNEYINLLLSTTVRLVPQHPNHTNTNRIVGYHGHQKTHCSFKILTSWTLRIHDLMPTFRFTPFSLSNLFKIPGTADRSTLFPEFPMTHHDGKPYTTPKSGCVNGTLTVIALGAGVGCHGAVTGEVFPLLDAHAHVGTRVLLACGAGTWYSGNGRGMSQQ